MMAQRRTEERKLLSTGLMGSTQNLEFKATVTHEMQELKTPPSPVIGGRAQGGTPQPVLNGRGSGRRGMTVVIIKNCSGHELHAEVTNQSEQAQPKLP